LAKITALEIELGESQKQNKTLSGKLGKLNKNLQSMQSENEKVTHYDS